MLQGIVGLDAAFGVVVQHPQDQVLELQVVGNRVAGLARPAATWPARLHAQDGVELTRSWGLVLLWTEKERGRAQRRRGERWREREREGEEIDGEREEREGEERERG